MRLKHRDRHAHGSAEEAHVKVQTEASDRSLSTHISHQERGLQLRFQTFFFAAGAAGFAGRWQSVGVDSVGLRKVLMEDRVSLIFWNCWDPLHTLKLQVFFIPCERDMTKDILMIFTALHKVRSDYASALSRVCGRRTAVMLLRLHTAIVSAFSL